MNEELSSINIINNYSELPLSKPIASNSISIFKTIRIWVSLVN